MPGRRALFVAVVIGALAATPALPTAPPVGEDAALTISAGTGRVEGLRIAGEELGLSVAAEEFSSGQP